jgi:hypothetical protein
MQVRHPSEAAPTDTGKTREGEMADKVMLEGMEGTPGNYRLLLENPITDWTTPRHRHDFDQIRYPLKGDFNYAPGKWLRQGTVGYFPEGVYYGPQVKPAGAMLALFQFGGPSGSGYSSNRQKKAMYKRMLEEGRFEGGVYTYIDAQGRKHNQDAAEARRERITGHKMDYRPRFEDLIIMNPANYPWLPDSENPAVHYKWLGSFTERGLRVGFVRLEQGATINIGEHNAPEMLLVLSGDVGISGKSCSEHTAIGVEGREGPVPLKAAKASELIYLKLHVFD